MCTQVGTKMRFSVQIQEYLTCSASLEALRLRMASRHVSSSSYYMHVSFSSHDMHVSSSSHNLHVSSSSHDMHVYRPPARLEAQTLSANIQRDLDDMRRSMPRASVR